jgi:hypothetical protein
VGSIVLSVKDNVNLNEEKGGKAKQLFSKAGDLGSP